MDPGFASPHPCQDPSGFGGAHLSSARCWHPQGCSAPTNHQLEQAPGHAAPRASPAQGWRGCTGRQPHIPPQPSLTPSPPTAPATGLFFPSEHKNEPLKVTPARLSRLSAAAGSTCLSHLCILNGFLCVQLRTPPHRSRPGKKAFCPGSFFPCQGCSFWEQKLAVPRHTAAQGVWQGWGRATQGREDLATHQSQQDRPPGQRCSTKPSSLRVALAFPRSFAAASRSANAFPQPSDLAVVTGRFAPEQTPLEALGNVSNPSSECLLSAFSPCPAAGWQWGNHGSVEILGSWHRLGPGCLWGGGQLS